MSGLIGHWPLHEWSGEPQDLSPEGNNGVKNSDPTQGVAGRGGLTATSFDGSNDYVDIGTPIVSDKSTTPSFSVGCWARFGDLSASSPEIIVGEFGGFLDQQPYALYINDTDNEIQFEINESDDSRINVGDSVSNYSENTWYYLTAVADSGSGQISLYIDAASVGSAAWDGTMEDTQNLIIGDRAPNDRPFNGLLCDVRIYNRALSANEVSTLYEWGSADYHKQSLSDGTDSGAVSRWTFDGDVNDSWGSNDGTATGMTFSNDAIRGQSGSFNGTNDKVEISDSSSLDISGARTISGWINPNTIQNGPLLTKGTYRGTTLQYEYWCGLAGTGGDTIIFRVSDGSSHIVDVSHTHSLNTGSWYFITFVWDGTTNSDSSKIFLNGTPVEASSATGSSGQTANNTVEIGGEELQDDWFDGMIDDVRLFNRALSDWEVYELYRWGSLGRDLRERTVTA